MNLATLFGKLQGYEIELNHLAKGREGDKKKKNLANVKDMESEDEDCQSRSDEDVHLIFSKFMEFLEKGKNVQNFKSKLKKGQSSFQVTSDVETKTHKGICPHNQIKFRRYKRSQKNSERTYIA